MLQRNGITPVTTEGNRQEKVWYLENEKTSPPIQSQIRRVEKGIRNKLPRISKTRIQQAPQLLKEYKQTNMPDIK